MKLTLLLDAAALGIRACLTEEWEEPNRTATMAPMVRVFDSEAQAMEWGRAMARRRGLTRLYLTDNRKPPADAPHRHQAGSTD